MVYSIFQILSIRWDFNSTRKEHDHDVYFSCGNSTLDTHPVVVIDR